MSSPRPLASYANSVDVGLRQNSVVRYGSDRRRLIILYIGVIYRAREHQPVSQRISDGEESDRLFQLKRQTERLIKAAKERIARVRKVEETATTDALRKQAQREQQRIASLTAKLLTATNELIAKFKKNGTLR
jgi:hypothetical protein